MAIISKTNFLSIIFLSVLFVISSSPTLIYASSSNSTSTTFGVKPDGLIDSTESFLGASASVAINMKVHRAASDVHIQNHTENRIPDTFES
ncbi:hypothetical protein L484_004370 [Morus notabilis]|uniref:Uncharacterized protein n=1 Tax=Morus notabilis TaxID=981085 RepID=W9RLE7_9ROSA|nr:hypothetical protein L484_004370 [Morus notabilis]